MKKFLSSIFLLLFLITPVYAQKINDLDPQTAPSYEDFTAILHNPTSLNPVTQKTSIANLAKALGWVDVRSYASINAAVAAIGSTQTTLFIPNEQTLAASLIIPSTLSLFIPKGGMIVKASTYTLTINGSFSAGLYQVFLGFSAGDVTFGSGSVKEVYPEWWGAIGDGLDASASKNTVAIQAAINSAINTRHVTFAGSSIGKYTVSDMLTISGHAGQNNYFINGLSNADGYRRRGVSIAMSGSGNASKHLFEILGSYGNTISNLNFYGNNDGTTTSRSKSGIYLHRTSNSDPAVTATRLENVNINYFKTGLRIGSYDFNEGNNEDGTFIKVSVNYCNIGIAQAWPNQMNNNFYDSSVTYCTYGLAIGQNTADGDVASSQTGDMSFFTMNWGHNTSDIYFKNDIPNLNIQGVRIEGSTAFITRSVVGSYNFSNLTISGGYMQPARTGFIIDSPLGFHLFQSVIFGSPIDPVPRFKFGYGNVTFVNCSFLKNPLDDGVSIFTKKPILINCREWDGGNYRNLADQTGEIKTENHYPITDGTYYLGKNDDDSPLAWKGVILKDTTNGKYYRIEVINGTITATDLTD